MSEWVMKRMSWIINCKFVFLWANPYLHNEILGIKKFLFQCELKMLRICILSKKPGLNKTYTLISYKPLKFK